MPDGTGEWSGHARWVITKLTEHDNRFSKLEDMATEMKVEIGKLQVKSGIYGAVAGALVVLFSMWIHGKL